MRGNALSSLGRLLDKGVKVSLVYGDRDYQCNWLGGEQASLSIESASVPSEKFQEAGYAKIETNDSYTGGFVRQLGSLSFARVFEAGHAGMEDNLPFPSIPDKLVLLTPTTVPYYQPETAYQIFQRVMFNKDVATGKAEAAAEYSSTGSNTAFALDGTAPELPPFGQEDRDCYVWDILETCDKGQGAMIGNGTAITKDFIMVGFRLDNGTEVMYPGGLQADGEEVPGAGPPAGAAVQIAGGVARFGSMGAATLVGVLGVAIFCSGGVSL